MIVALIFPIAGIAATINVPADQPTIQGAENAANAGDVIVVANGTYNEQVNINQSNITIRAANRHGAVVDCQNTRQHGFHAVPGTDNVTIDGFEIKNCEDSGVHFDEGSQNFQGWEIRYNLIHHIWENGIRLRGTSSNHNVHHNEIYFVGNAQESMGIKIEAWNASIHDNQIYAVAKNCMRNGRADNDIYNNILYQCYACLASNTSNGGSEIFNNLLYQCTDGYKPKHNKCSEGRHNAYEWFYHNTVVYMAHSSVDVGTNDPPTSCVSVKNNIFVTTIDVNKGYTTDVSVKVREDKTTNYEMNGNFYDLDGSGIYADNPNDTEPDYATLAQLRANTPYETNGFYGNIQLGDHKTGTKYQPGSAAFDGSLNLPTSYGLQLGAHGLTQTAPRLNIVKTVSAINASSLTGQLGRLTDGRDDTRWLPRTETGWVILELNNGAQVTFDTFWAWHWVNARNTIESWILQTGNNQGGPWTTIHNAGPGDTDTLGGLEWAYFPGEVTTRYLRYQWNSTHRNDGGVFSQFQVSNFVEQDDGGGEPPPPPPTAVAYGPNAEACVTTQQTATTSLVIVPDNVTDPELAVETNTDATILIRAGTYSANDFNVQDDNIVLPYNCDSVIINMLGTETNNWTGSGWTVAGLQIDCSDVVNASCVNMIGSNNTIRNNEFRNGDTAFSVTGTTSGNTIQGNIFDGVGGNNGIDDLLRFSGSITSTDFKENWIRLDPTNNTAGNSAVSVDGVNGGSGFQITDNLFTDANMIEHYIEMENNTVAIEISYNTFIGPFSGTGADGEASYAIELGDGPLGSDCYPTCPSHSIHHNYCDDSYMLETPSVGGKLASCWRVSTTKSWAGTLEFNIDNNSQNAADYVVPNVRYSGVTDRHNTRISGTWNANGEACTRDIAGGTYVLSMDNNVFDDVRIVDECTAAADWSITNTVRSDTIGDFDPDNLGAGNSTDTLTFQSILDASLDLTILGSTHNQKAALPSPTVSSAQVGNDCVLQVVMAPFIGFGHDHGPISSATSTGVTVNYSGSANPTILNTSVSTNTINYTLSSCPLDTDTVTFDATHGWCNDSANIGSSFAENAEDFTLPARLRARCLAVTGQSVTNNVTPGGATTFYVDNSCGTDGDGTTAVCGATGPWNTLESALVTNACAGMSAGDILDISGGEPYYENENLSVPTACSDIIIQNTSGENVVFDGTVDISAETWNAIGGGVYETDYNFGDDEYPYTAWYDTGGGEQRLDLIHTVQTCDDTLAAGFMRYNPTTNAVCAHLADSSSPASASYFRIPQQEAFLRFQDADADNVIIRVNPGGGSFTVQRYAERGITLNHGLNTGITINGLNLYWFLDAAIGASGGTGITSTSVINNTIQYIGVSGIRIEGDTGNGSITGNTISDIQTTPIFEQCIGVGAGCHGTKTDDGAAIRLKNNNGIGYTISENTIKTVGGGISGRAYGIWLRNWAENNTVDSNYIAHISNLVDTGYGIALTGENANEFHDNNSFINNRIYDVDICYSQEYEVSFENQDGLENVFEHNTCVDPVKYGMVAQGDDSHTGSLVIRNNIFSAYNTSPIFLFTRTNDIGWNYFSYNAIECDSCSANQDVISYRCNNTMELSDYCTPGLDCLADWNQTSLRISGNVEGNTNVNTTGQDPSLQIDNASIAYDAGVGGFGVNDDYLGTSRPQGSEVDIGAHESADAQLSVDLEQHAFRFYNRFGQAGVDPLAAENVVPSRSIYERSEWNLRFAVIGQDGTDANLATLSPAYQHCNPTCGSWTALTTSCTGTAACLHDNPDRSDSEAITSDIALDGRIFHTGSSYYDTSTQITDILIDGLRQVELEYSLKMGDQMDEDDVILFRVQYTSGSALEAYTETPSITVGPGRGTIRVNRHSTVIETIEE